MSVISKSQSTNNLFLLLQLLIFYIISVNAKCQLTTQLVAKEKRIFATKSGNSWTILRRDYVENAEKLYMICPDKSNIVLKCQHNGNFSTLTPRVNETCDKGMKEEVRSRLDINCVELGGTMYDVGYMLGRFHTLYSSCYNAKKVRAIYAVHEAYDFNMVFAEPRQSFTLDGLFVGTIADSYRRSDIFTRFQQLLGTEQKFATGSASVIHRGHLVPSGDFTFPYQMRDTFKYLNVVPQISAVNVSPWKRIENWTRKKAKEQMSPLTVVTGVLEPVLQLPHSSSLQWVPMYLLPNNINPIPMWMFKSIKAETSCTIFVTLNRPFIEVAKNPNRICNIHPCPDATIFAGASGFSYCCEQRDFIARYPNYPVC